LVLVEVLYSLLYQLSMALAKQVLQKKPVNKTKLSTPL